MTDQSDLDRFWAAVEGYEAQQLPLEALLERDYFGRASPALFQYSAWSGLNSQRLAEAFLAHPTYMLALKDRAVALTPYLDVQPMYARLTPLLPTAVSAQVHLLMGDFSCAGTVGPGQILLGLEFWPDPQLRALAPSGLLVLLQSQLPGVLAHELIHVQQAERFPALAAELSRLTLLQLTLLEGAAEYLGTLLSGQQLNLEVHRYGAAHAAELWPLFWAQAESLDWGNWFYSAPKRAGWPSNLGYFIGYELCRLYHERHIREQGVVADIVQGFRTPALFQSLL